MSEKQSNLFSQIKKKTNINPTDIFKVANSVQNADFSDETTVRDLVKKLSQMANKPISKEKEDKLVKVITQNKLPKDMNTLGQQFKK
ncbi:MAG: stage VI sporulation protein F [Amphibacillus sp.]|uniref:Stage VI sporulation protein F n=1 Tax=Amphibacillus xylanus (strain ATCC 51415 / DSM 6626 / JCM 7361 / LMG 17667 / NBRC 15112 / Ep01) TaxID=698758 RepID=K0J2J9_AMPXN|nr:stage VI sporulation protein F [Amphibacillus xylanus]NMA91377.1 stage VI sporulation protein F [Amphibacillus sp.]BAM47367.1 hypothetical protein AXY_12350 [Amphibacillus xylanus NBRC 15112]